MAIALSHTQAAPLLDAYRRGEEKAMTSFDLSRSQVEVSLSPGGVRMPDGQMITWNMLEKILQSLNGCFTLNGNDLHKIQAYSSTTERMCSLMPTTGAPTLLLGGFPMHRIKDVDPWEDTRRKLHAAAPINGRVLDTTTGLGYTAIQASRTAQEVVTVEIDPTVLDIAQQNPWSEALFTTKHISQLIGDSAEVITEFPDSFFDRIIHDPPTFSLAGDLYSRSFYTQVHRVLNRRGRVFHYVGDPASSLGKRVTRGVVQRLKEAGFQTVQPHPRAFGVVAYR
jgi:predicted methyltransferase